ncbi:AP-1 complex subunit mu-1 isoform X1 [Pipistrellus kuhlii]|uniref:AP-1 complex subunit mu-1 isoform X1 n=1 Tax=Pipistrellus kuhlii TaxID=59472 RepID=UPI001E272FD0|nr:AP-1 complex subunit mu-1 isoform X1 [Pipistrellus kuhlii]
MTCSLSISVLICRNYRGDVDMSEVEHFMPILMEKEEEGMLSPILAHGGVRFMWIKHNNLYLVATSKKNACVSLVFSFLYKVVQVFSEYFKELEEESIRDNFVIIYELLDELMDFGYPQTTDSKILQEYITQEGHKLETGAPRPPATVTNAVSWRSEGIRYRKNEVFLDVIESVNLLVSANGNVLRSEIVGSIKMRVFLSGMPELRLGLNDKVLFDNTGRGKSKSVELEDVKFHQCVRLSRFENDRTISFIPPDGEFELMSYRLNTHVKPLIWIESVIEKHSHSRIEYMIKAKSQFKRRSTANNVEIHIPVPNDADSPKFKTTVGSVKWVPENSEIVWSIKSFPITSSGPSEGQCQPGAGAPGEALETCQARRKDTTTLATIPALPGDPSSSGRTCSAVSHLSPKPLPPEEACLPDAPSPRPGPPGEGAVFPRGHGSLGCAVPGTGTWELPAARGTFWPPAVLSAVFPECLWGFVFVLVAVYVNRALCSSCSSSRSSQQHLVGTGAPPRPPSTLRILHRGQSPALRPLGLLAWTAGFGEVPPQGRLCHTGCRSTTSVFVRGEGVQGAPGLRGHRSSTPVLGHPSPSVFVS